MAKWQASGDYFETCNCDFLCPCTPSNLMGKMTYEECIFAFVFHIERGNYDGVKLDGLNFAAIGRSPGPAMADGNLAVGLVIDERATAEQQEAIIQIGSGQGGGPMAALGPLVTQMLGVETRPIHFEKQAMHCSVNIPGTLELAVEGVPGMNPEEPLYLDNTIHPVNSRLALAKAAYS